MHTGQPSFSTRLACPEGHLNMRVPAFKILLFICIAALSLTGTAGIAAPTGFTCFADVEMSLAELEAELGSSCYVASEFTSLPEALPDTHCEEEDDGLWGTDFPEGMSPQDHPDELPSYPVYSWRVLSPVRQLVSGAVCQKVYSLHPGALYPPPQQ